MEFIFALMFSAIYLIANSQSVSLGNSDGCSGSTCSPASCTMVNNTACVPNVVGMTTAKITALATKTIQQCTNCTQSTNSICDPNKIASVFAKGIASGSLAAVYCNDNFLIIQSNSLPNHDDSSLAFVPRPPGGGGTPSYSTQCVTRSHVMNMQTYSIPLNPIALSTSSGLINNVNSFINNMETYTAYPVALPNEGPIGVTVTGLPLYPSLNNDFSWLACEEDLCNAHCGQGFDYHYHGDPFGPKCMYSAADYDSTTAHPPIIGFGLDGFTIYGRYLDDTAPGYSVALDDCGGHTHSPDTNGYGYHYHAQVLNVNVTKTALGLTAGQKIKAYINGPFKCWKGDISSIPNFWNSKLNAYACKTMGKNYYGWSGVTLCSTSS